ncbi:MAG: dihydropteroate synthase [Burkholderiales bacterium 35-55-47]|jgi:dihydropteroate synthase|uniref:dihydropteroate synthase n=1 Tax=Limnohabitans sp. TaxID=1907725 RepID=UPI000BD5F290|nr:dihydropteroate synthase [Limnohabitans sp.]OYY19730.1 MAG: dihydropteroate synthase [Burkholderiales bacterium 35-55-47]OYZ74660.1 MAG: dihydropteroate synthase [Burkholderiales bacterium 24-55-52]OZB01451.1 MAG: dihydropteroate synthase [Burkholderiales bacterium 39-55-53]HQR85926.1 dihydropteroate synthase [Limnohabitans sp.]HQS26158.1 dihydropteroate synthase [Limnohabitans sp.]
MFWQTTRFRIDLSQPQIMGIVNVTPDSFSDGGQHASTRAALTHCEQLLKEGANILDIGGESTRPGAPAVSLDDELARVLPVVREAVRWKVPVSVDTYKAEVMQAVLDAGVDIINDVWALRQSGAQHVVAAHANCGVCLMHMHGEPQTMQTLPMQGSSIQPVAEFLKSHAQALQTMGVGHDRIALDPGVGFGKTVAQNFELLAHQDQLLVLGYPLLIGWSRKSSIGAVTGCKVGERMVPSVAAAVLAVERGARIVRVHDVVQTVQALKVWQAAQV